MGADADGVSAMSDVFNHHQSWMALTKSMYCTKLG